MSKAAENLATWAEANRLLGALAAGVGGGMEARLGAGGDPGDWAERAAIMEYDGGLPREAAERFACKLASFGPYPSSEALAALDTRLGAMNPRRVGAASTRARRP